MPYSKNQNLALIILRIVIAALFFVAAYYKIPFWKGETLGMSAGMVNLMKFLSIVEPLGALAVLIGFLTRWAALGLAIILLGAIYVTKITYHTGFVTPAGPGWNFPLTAFACCVVLMGFGAGNWSVSGRK
jgi:putative oxidoreductase